MIQWICTAGHIEDDRNKLVKFGDSYLCPKCVKDKPPMSTEADIVERLRWPGISGPDDHPVSAALRAEAADLITNVRAANAALKQMVSDKDGLLTALRAERDALRKLINDYLTGDFGPDLASKHDKCPHGQFGWEACEACIDGHFNKGLALLATEGKTNG